LLGFWFLLSGSIDWQHILVGVVATALVTMFWRKPDDNNKGFRLRTIFYGTWLAAVMLVEIWRSAWHVALIVLSCSKVSPKLVWVDTPLQLPLSRVFFANCISLTPGTLTISLVGNRLLVHALTHEFGGGLTDWKVHKILKKMEGMV